MMHKVKITYLRLSGYRPSYIVMSNTVVEERMADQTIRNLEKMNMPVVYVENVAWCGWNNTWTDSGDRGAAHADHMTHCDICVE